MKIFPLVREFANSWKNLHKSDSYVWQFTNSWAKRGIASNLPWKFHLPRIVLSVFHQFFLHSPMGEGKSDSRCHHFARSFIYFDLVPFVTVPRLPANWLTAKKTQSLARDLWRTKLDDFKVLWNYDMLQDFFPIFNFSSSSSSSYLIVLKQYLLCDFSYGFMKTKSEIKMYWFYYKVIIVEERLEKRNFLYNFFYIFWL